MSIDIKSPWVIGGGVLLALVLLSRGSSANNQAAQSNASDDQASLAQSNVALSSIAIPAQYQYLAALSNNDTSMHVADTSMITSVLNSALANSGAIYTSAIDANGITAKNYSPNEPAVAKANALAATSIAASNASAQVQVAQINSQAAQNIASSNGLFGFLGGALNPGSAMTSVGSGGVGSSAASGMSSMLPLIMSML